MADFIYEAISSNCVLRTCAFVVFVYFSWFYDHIAFFKKVAIAMMEFIFVLFIFTGMPFFFLMFH